MQTEIEKIKGTTKINLLFYFISDLINAQGSQGHLGTKPRQL